MRGHIHFVSYSFVYMPDMAAYGIHAIYRRIYGRCMDDMTGMKGNTYHISNCPEISLHWIYFDAFTRHVYSTPSMVSLAFVFLGYIHVAVI
jgi:hypothetical protein